MPAINQQKVDKSSILALLLYSKIDEIEKEYFSHIKRQLDKI